MGSPLGARSNGESPISARSARNTLPWATIKTGPGRASTRASAQEARARTLAKLSAPSGVASPLIHASNQASIGWPSRAPKEASRSSGSMLMGASSPKHAATISAVRRARAKGELTIAAMPAFRKISPAFSACAMPLAFNGISTLPWARFCAFQSVSP